MKVSNPSRFPFFWYAVLSLVLPGSLMFKCWVYLVIQEHMGQDYAAWYVAGSGAAIISTGILWLMKWPD